MLLTGLVPGTAAASGGGLGEGSSGSSNSSSSSAYVPYAISPAVFPAPTAYSPSSGVSGVAITPLPGAYSSFAVVTASVYGVANSSNATLGFAELSYSASAAEQIALTGTCGENCGQLPLNWSDDSVIASFDGPITAERAAVAGGALIVAASSGGYTYLFNWSAGQGSWISIGPAIYGTVASLAANPQTVAVATLQSGSLLITTLTVEGQLLADQTLEPTGSASSGVLSAGVAFVPRGAAYQESVAFSTTGSDEIEFSSSSSGTSFSLPSVAGNFSTSTGSGPTSAGGASLVYSGGEAGQVALAAVQSELFLLYTTNNSSQTVPETASSSTFGATWEGPYFEGPINGTTHDPSLTVGPTGMVYAVWEDPDFGTGAVELATYFPDGTPAVLPETLVPPSGYLSSPSGPPAIGVDDFARPLVAWPSNESNGSGSLEYTGGFLEANESVAYLESAADQSLTSADFTNVGSDTALPSLLANISSNGESIVTNLTAPPSDANNSSGGNVSNLSLASLCAAQNRTARALYQNATDIPLSVLPGSGTVCATDLSSTATRSTLLDDEGLDVPTTYLGLYADWALEAEGVPISGSPLGGLSEVSPYTEVVPSASLPTPQTRSVTTQSETETITATPTPYSPTAYELAVSANLPTWTKFQIGSVCGVPPNEEKYSYLYTTTVAETWGNLSVNNGTRQSFPGGTTYKSVWIDDLPAYETYSWNASFTATTKEVRETTDPCTDSTSNQTVSPVTVGPKSIPTIWLDGTFATTLSISYGSALVTAKYNANDSAAGLTVSFNQTLPAAPYLSLTNPTGAQRWNATSFAIPEDYTFPARASVGGTYTFAISTASRGGSSSSPGNTTFEYAGSGDAPPETASETCQFTLTKSLPKVWNASGGPYSDVNGSTMTVEWFSNQSATGFFTYWENGSSLDDTILGITPENAGSGVWEYEVEVHGLEPWADYNGTFGVSTTYGCLTDQDGVTSQVPATGTDPGSSSVQSFGWAWELDLPYDSLTQTGGGLEVGWSHHVISGRNGPLTGGDIVIGPTSDPVFSYSIPASNTTTQILSGSVDLTPGLEIDRSYPIEVSLNYSHWFCTAGACYWGNKTVTTTGSFVYEKDTSGDGLTDVEKEQGWLVPLAPGATFRGRVSPSCVPAANANESQVLALQVACTEDPSALVTANPVRYSTNGLVSDYVEKEYDLNPNTIDTAKSHMLDTWNLTFDLGPGSPALPTKALFHYTYENTTYNFSRSCQIFNPAGGGCSFRPGSVTSTNLTDTKACPKKQVCPLNGWVGDSAPWAAEQLWSSNNLAALEALIRNEGVGWLRAVTGHYGADRTITVWGKLSWGANPLVTSTSEDGLPDGSQADPQGAVLLQFNLTSWAVNDAPSVNGGIGVAPYLSVRAGNGTGTWYYAGYGPCSGPGCEGNDSWVGAPSGQGTWWVPWWGNYSVAVPIVTSASQVYWQVQMIDNDSNSGQLWDIANTSLNTSRMTWGAVNLSEIGQRTTESVPLCSENNCNGSEGSVSLSYEVLATPTRANTLLVAPEGQTTLSTGPWGLKRYIGEPDFDLLVLNLTDSSTPITISNLANAEGSGTYNVTLDPGLNNLLVPRGIFLDSPLGQALVNNTNETVNVAPGSGFTFYPTDWSSRIEQGPTNPVPNNNGSNNSTVRNPSYLWVFTPGNESVNASNDSSASAYGGVPAEPSLEAGFESRQVQAVFWINISGSSGYAGLADGAAELRDLLGGLALNSTGMVSTDVLDVTWALPTLGLPSSVLDLMANATVSSAGAYSYPTYNSALAQSPDGFQRFLQDAWNTVSGVANLFSVLWTPVVAAEAYLAGALGGALTSVSHGLARLVSQAVASLSIIERAMEWAVEQLVAHIKKVVVSGFQIAFGDPNATAAQVGFDLSSSRVDFSAGNTLGAGNLFAGATAFPLRASTAVATCVIVASELLLPIATLLVLPIGPIIGGLLLNSIGGPSGGGSAPAADPVGSSESAWLVSLCQLLKDLFPTVSNSTEELFGWIVPVLAFVGLVAYVVQLAIDSPDGNALALPFAGGFMVMTAWMTAIADAPGTNSSTQASAAVAALFFAGISLVCDTIAILGGGEELNPVVAMVIAIVDAVIVWWAIDDALSP